MHGMVIFEEIIWVVVAVGGGVAKYMNTLLTSKSPTFEFLRFFARLTVGAFSGYMFARAAHIANPEWDIFAAGIGGWLGADGMEYAASFIRSRVEKDDK